MLICKNCNTQNESGSKRCCHCNMEGMLVKDNTRPIQKEEKVHNSCKCRNCGEENEPIATACVKCRFPLVNSQRSTSKKVAAS